MAPSLSSEGGESWRSARDDTPQSDATVTDNDHSVFSEIEDGDTVATSPSTAGYPDPVEEQGDDEDNDDATIIPPQQSYDCVLHLFEYPTGSIFGINPWTLGSEEFQRNCAHPRRSESESIASGESEGTPGGEGQMGRALILVPPCDTFGEAFLSLLELQDREGSQNRSVIYPTQLTLGEVERRFPSWVREIKSLGYTVPPSAPNNESGN